MTRPVVVGIDDFDRCDELIAVAAQEARLRGASLRLAHACDGFAPEQVLSDAAEAGLAAIAARIAAGHPELSVTTAVVAGPAAAALAEIAGSAALLVVGRRGGGPARLPLGSVSSGVLHHADCPVLVVREARKTPRHHVLIGIDVEPPATGPQALEFAFAEAERRHAGLHAVHVWEDPSIPYAHSNRTTAIERRKEALKHRHKVLGDVLAPWKQAHPGLEVSGEALAGLPAELLAAATESADLMVLGGRARQGRKGMRIGGVAHTVLRRAHCPVVIVPEH